MEILYSYDGSLPGFLCCVFDSYLYHETPADIQSAGALEPTLFSVREVVTDEAHARRVRDKLMKLSPMAWELTWKGFLTCAADREMLLYRFIRRLLQGEVIDPGADGGEVHAFATVFPGQLQAGAVAGFQQLRLPVAASVPHRAGGMDDVFCRQAVALGYLGLAGLAAVESAAFCQQLRTGGPVYGPVHAAAPQQGAVGGVDYGVGVLLCDVSKDYPDVPHGIHSFASISTLPSAAESEMDLTFVFLPDIIFSAMPSSICFWMRRRRFRAP